MQKEEIIMKHVTKKLTALVLAALLVLSLGVSA